MHAGHGVTHTDPHRLRRANPLRSARPPNRSSMIVSCVTQLCVTQLCAFDLQLRSGPLPRRSRRRSSVLLSSAAPPPDDEPEKSRSPLESLADASWDLFVMPGEYANSRYDKSGRESIAEPAPVRNETSAAFDWGGGRAEDEALRLPTGVAAAERLAAASGQPTTAERERRRRDQQQVQLLPLAVLAIPLAAGIIEVGIAGFRALSVPPATTEQHAKERKLTEAEWIARRLENRRAAGVERPDE